MLKFKFWCESKERINSILNSGWIFFFTHKGELYGTGEEGRLVFATMKNPRADQIDDTFSAVNLYKLLKGEESKSVFSKKDLKDIKIIDQNKAEKLLSKK